jgi:DnaJ family protein A protein 5
MAGAIRCHYEVLEVERTANDDEIKKAFRKLALKVRPQKQTR